MGEKSSIDKVDFVLGGEFFNHVRTTLWVGAVVFCDDFHRTSSHASQVIDVFCGGIGCSLIPFPVSCSYPSPVNLKTDSDRCITSCSIGGPGNRIGQL